MRRLHRGDLSAPVLAIIVTIGIIAAGLVLMAWFWWFAPQAGKAGTLQILGIPVYNNVSNSVYIAIKNSGNDRITIKSIIVNGTTCATVNRVIEAGASDVIEANCTTPGPTVRTRTIDGAITTDQGVFPITFNVITGRR
jgi:hypothetical protein